MYKALIFFALKIARRVLSSAAGMEQKSNDLSLILTPFSLSLANSAEMLSIDFFAAVS
jgi:hypothetical protein